jgi:hypothetical protein
MKHWFACAAIVSLLGAATAAHADGTPTPPAPTPAPAPRPVINVYALKVTGILNEINIAGCKKANGPVGPGKVHIVIGASGQVASSTLVTPSPYDGSPVGGCIAGRYRGARFPPPPNNASYETDYTFELK